MQDWYLDNVFMYGTYAKDIKRFYPGFYCNFNDITYQDTPEKLYRYANENCIYKFNQNITQDYNITADKARKLAKRAKFPLPLFLSIISVLFLLSIVFTIIKDIEIGKAFLLFFGMIIMIGLPFGIGMLIRGAIIRDSASYKATARAVSSEIYVTNNEIIVFVNGQDYPTYNKKINMIGQYIPFGHWQYLQTHTINSLAELGEIEKNYNKSLDKPLLFNQAFIIRTIHAIETDKNNHVMNIIADCDIYTNVLPPIGTRHYSTDVPADHVILSAFYRYVFGFRENVKVSVPYINDLFFTETLIKLKGNQYIKT